MKITMRKPTTKRGKPEVGNVYRAIGGRRNSTCYWILMGMSESGGTLYFLGFDPEGEVSSTASYNKHSFEDRPIIGKANLQDMKAINVEWY